MAFPCIPALTPIATMDASWAVPPQGLPAAAAMLCQLLAFMPPPAVLPLGCVCYRWAYAWWIYKENIRLLCCGMRPLFVTITGENVVPRESLLAFSRLMRAREARLQARIQAARRRMAEWSSDSDDN